MDINTFKSAAQAYGFYDTPIHKLENKKPDYYDLFTWKSSDNSNIFYGYLREELFNTIDKKIAYLQGIFEDSHEGCGIIKGENWINFANSQNKVDRCKRWINDIARFMCQGKIISLNNENAYLSGISTGGIIKHVIEYKIPICHVIYLQPQIIDFIKNYQPKI